MDTISEGQSRTNFLLYGSKEFQKKHYDLRHPKVEREQKTPPQIIMIKGGFMSANLLYKCDNCAGCFYAENIIEKWRVKNNIYFKWNQCTNCGAKGNIIIESRPGEKLPTRLLKMDINYKYFNQNNYGI